MTKVSIIIPAKNEEKMLKLTAPAIKSQTLKPEIIYVVETSKDDTLNICSRYGDKTIYLQSDPNTIDIKKVALLRNLGHKYSTGDIVIHADADILLTDKNQLKRLIDTFIKYDLKVATPVIQSAINDLHSKIREFYRKRFEPIATQFIIIKREIFDKVGGFPYTVWHDVAFSNKLKRFGYRIKIINEHVIHLRRYHKWFGII